MQLFGAVIMEVGGTAPQMEIGEENAGVVAKIHVEHKAWATHLQLIAVTSVMKGTIDAMMLDNLSDNVTKTS